MFEEVGIRAVVQGYGTYMSQTANINKSTEGLKTGLGGLQKVALIGGAALAGVGAAAMMLAKSSIGAAAQMETYVTQFKVLLGSADAAKARLAELAKFAAITPFELPEVVQASKLLQTFGGTALATGKTLTMVGDMAAASGAGYGEIATWVGRAYTAIQSGRPFGEAGMRLQELALMSGETRSKLEELQKTGASSTVIWNAFTGSMSKYTGMMGELAVTFTGLTSTVADSYKGLLREFGTPLLEPAKAALTMIINFLSDPAVIAGAKALGEAVAGLGNQFLALFSDKVTGAAKGFGNILTDMAEKLKTVDISSFFKAAGDPHGALSKLVSALGDLGKALFELIPVMAKLGVGMGSIFLTILPKLIDAFLPLIELIADSPPLIYAMAAAFAAIKLAGLVTSVMALTSAVTPLSAAMVGMALAASGIIAIAGKLGLFTTEQAKSQRDLNAAMSEGQDLFERNLITAEELARRTYTAQVQALKDMVAEQILAMETLSSGAQEGSKVWVQENKKSMKEMEEDVAELIKGMQRDKVDYIDVIEGLKAAGIDWKDTIIEDVLKEMRLAYEDDIPRLVNLADAAALALAETGAAAGTSATDMAAATETAIKKMQEDYEKIKDSVKDILPTVDETFAAWKARIEGMAKAYAEFPENIRKLYVLFRDAGVDNAYAVAEGWASQGPEMTAAALTYFKDIPVEALQEAGVAMTTVMGTNLADVNTEFTSWTVKYEADAATRLKAAGRTIADAIAEGMKEGFKLASGEIYTAADMMAGMAIDAMEKRGGVKSPSTVTTKIADEYGTGFANGMIDSADKVVDAAEKVTIGAILALQRGQVPAATAGETFAASFASGAMDGLLALRQEMKSAVEPVLAVLNAGIKEEEAYLADVAAALVIATAEHTRLGDALKVVKDDIAIAKGAMDDWKNAVLEGTRAFSDAGQAIDESSNKLGLAIAKVKLGVLEEGLEAGDYASEKLSAKIRTLASLIGVDLHGAGKLTFEGIQKVLEAAGEQMDIFSQKASVVNLQEKVKLGPEQYKLEKFFQDLGGYAEFSYEEIITGATDAAREMAVLIIKQNDLNLSIERQAGLVDFLNDVQKQHEEILGRPQKAYDDLFGLTSKIDQSIKAIWEAQGGDQVIKSIEEAFAAIDRGQTDAATAAMANATTLFDSIKAAIAVIYPGKENLLAPIETLLGEVETKVEIDVGNVGKLLSGDLSGISDDLGAVDKSVVGVQGEVTRGFMATMNNLRDWVVTLLYGIAANTNYLGELLDIRLNTEDAVSELIIHTDLLGQIRDAIGAIEITAPAAQKGAYVRSAGLASLHAGEFVWPNMRTMVEELMRRTTMAGGGVASAYQLSPHYLPSQSAGGNGGGMTINNSPTFMTPANEMVKQYERSFRSLAFSLRRP